MMCWWVRSLAHQLLPVVDTTFLVFFGFATPYLPQRQALHYFFFSATFRPAKLAVIGQ